MTQAKLAAWLGVTIKQVKHLEHQRRSPSGPTSRLLDILAEHLKSNNTSAVQVLGASVAVPKNTRSDKNEGQKPSTDAALPEQVPLPPADQVGDGAFVWT